MPKTATSKPSSTKLLKAASVKPETRVARVKPDPSDSKPAKAKPKAGATAGKSSAEKTAANSKQVRAGSQAQVQATPVPPVQEKSRKPKLVRDSFTMPEAEYQVLRDVKKACLKAGIDVKKSELLRVGVALIKAMDTARLKQTIAALPPLKAGRPKQEK
jgi:hypothetical protein